MATTPLDSISAFLMGKLKKGLSKKVLPYPLGALQASKAIIDRLADIQFPPGRVLNIPRIRGSSPAILRLPIKAPDVVARLFDELLAGKITFSPSQVAQAIADVAVAWETMGFIRQFSFGTLIYKADVDHWKATKGATIAAAFILGCATQTFDQTSGPRRYDIAYQRPRKQMISVRARPGQPKKKAKKGIFG